MEKTEELSRGQKFVIGLKKTGYVLSCFVWVPLSIAVNLVVMPITLVPNWVKYTKTKEGGLSLSGFLLSPLVYGLFYPLAVPFPVAIEYGKNIGNKYQPCSFFDTFFAATQEMLDVGKSAGLQGHTAGQRFLCGLKRALFALSCALWIPLRFAISIALMPFAVITNCAFRTKKEGVKGFLWSILDAVAYPFYYMYNALRGVIRYGREVGTEQSTVRDFFGFLFYPAVDLAYDIKDLFAPAKTDSEPLVPSVPATPSQAEIKADEPNEPIKQTGDMIEAATNKSQAQEQPESDGQNLGEKKL